MTQGDSKLGMTLPNQALRRLELLVKPKLVVEAQLLANPRLPKPQLLLKQQLAIRPQLPMRPQLLGRQQQSLTHIKHQALREALRAASLQQNLAAQRTWLIQTFGFVESPRDSPIILKSLNARERALLHLAVQSFGHNLYSKSVTVCNGERWTCVGNRYAVVSNMNLIRERNSREEQLEQEERQRVHDEGYQTLVDAWNSFNKNGWDVRGTWEITCPEVGGSHSSRLLCSMNLFVGDCEDNTTDEKMVWAKFDFGSHTGSAQFPCPGSKKTYWILAEMLPGPASRDWLFRWREAGEVLEEKALCSLRFKGGAGLKLEGRWNGGEWFEGRKIAEME